MAKRKTSKKRKGVYFKDLPIVELSPGTETIPFDPDEGLRDVKFIARALCQALLKGDKKSFVTILRAHVRAKNISELGRRTKMKRSTIYAAIGPNANPTLETIINLIRESA